MKTTDHTSLKPGQIVIRFFARTLLAALAAISVVPAASAATGNDTWVGNTSALFSGANWTGVNNPPLAGDSLFFGVAGSAGASLTADQTAGISYAGITFNSGASAFTIGGANGITLAGNITNSSANGQTINFAQVLSGTNTHLIVNSTVATTMALGGTITRATGATAIFTTTGNISTTLTDANGMIGGWAVINNGGAAGSETYSWACLDPVH